MAEVKNIQAFKSIDPNATYLVMVSPEKIPHLAIVQKGLYYSLTYKKSVIGEDFLPYLEFLKRSSKKVLLLEIEKGKSSLKEAFLKYQMVESGTLTCLQPIKDWLSPVTDIEFVYQLIPFLYAENRIKTSYHLGMRDLLTGSASFTLREYKKEDIYSYIEDLNKKYV